MGMPVIKPSTMTRQESVGNIIESIAMEEASIANVLNAESLKLQKIISSPNATVDELLAANLSIRNAVDAVSRLEMALQSKLNMFADMICQIN